MSRTGRMIALFLAMVLAFSTLLPACAQEAEPDVLWKTAEEAYIYCYPLVLMSYTAQTLPKNQLVHARKLATPENKSVVTMNVDTLYSQIMMDLQDEPMVLVFPQSDRYMQMQVMDAWSNTVAVIGEAGVYAFVRAGSDADLPADMTKIEIPTRLSWCIGRTLLKGSDDLSNVIALQDAMDFRTLHSYLSGGEDVQDANAEVRKDVVPVKAVSALTGQEFFDCANRLMADNPPAAADGEIVERISKLGVGPGLQFDASILNDDAEGTGWKNMLKSFYADIQKDARNYAKALGKWSYFGEPIGDYGTDYVYRAAIAVSGFGANPVEVALYSKCAADEQGDAFSGAEDYVLHFDSLPPVLEKGFWSITAYNNEDFLIDNPMNRYNVNSFSDYTLGEDGSLDILLTAKDVTDSGMYVLPTDPEGFHLFMRIYMPDMEALEGWTAPVITKRQGHGDVRTNLENAGFLVQDGMLYEFETLRLASEGKVLTVFGNNAGSAYVILNLPPAPEQDAAPGNPERNWDGEMPTAYDDPEVENYPENPYFAPAGMHFKLRQDEAVVVITKLPDPCKYWSFIVYDMFSAVMEGKDYSTTKGFFRVGNERSGDYHTIFASVGSPVNMLNAKHDGDSAFGTEAVLVICANSTVRDSVLAQLAEAGYPESMVNVMEIPSGVYRVGLEKGRDTFSLFGRISQPEDREAYEQYMKGLAESATVLRVTPKEEVAAAPFPVAPLQARGSGVHETEKLVNVAENLDTIRRNILDQYSDEYDYEEFFTTIPFYDGITSYLNDMNAQGDVHDAAYLITGDFELKSDEDFVVVYGVNHAYTGKAHYFNAVMHERPMVNGVCSIYDSLLPGSADAYIGAHQDEADGYYVYKMARTQMDEHTAIIPYATGNPDGRYYGVDNGSPVFVIFRIYLDETGVGADYYELVYDRVIVFHKKA